MKLVLCFPLTAHTTAVAFNYRKKKMISTFLICPLFGVGGGRKERKKEQGECNELRVGS